MLQTTSSYHTLITTKTPIIFLVLEWTILYCTVIVELWVWFGLGVDPHPCPHPLHPFSASSSHTYDPPVWFVAVQVLNLDGQLFN